MKKKTMFACAAPLCAPLLPFNAAQAAPHCDLAVGMTASPGQANLGQTVAFTTTITNAGGLACAPGAGTVLTNQPAPGLPFVQTGPGIVQTGGGATWSCNWKTPPGALTCTTLQSLAPNYSAVFTYSATVGKSSITFTNCAVVNNVNDSATANDSRCRSVVVK